MHQLQILHISDLHIKEKEAFDRSLVFDPLIERIKFDKKEGIKPEIVIITGDIAFKGITPEYEIAKAFFDKLLDCLGLTNDRIFLVPGNHDVNRDKYRPGDIPAYKNMRELNSQLENEDHRKDLLKGMNDYFKFIHENYPHLKSKHGNIIPFVINYKSECVKNIGLIGLNSAWMCRKSPDRGNIAIGEYQVKKAMEELEEKGDMDIVINCCHHPLDWLWQKDRNRCRRYFNNSVLLAGHLHDAAGGLIKDLSGALHQFQSGGAYLGSESDWAQRYQYITFDWQGNHIRLDFRKYDKEAPKWCLDGETGNDGKIEFEMIQTNVKKSKNVVKYVGTLSSNPFRIAGTLPLNATSYIERECDSELAERIKSNKKKLIAIHGEWEIGKSSLLIRVMHLPFLASGNWDRYLLDIQDFFPFENLMEYFFKGLSDEVNCKIDSWKALDRFLINQPLVLCFDEFEILSAYHESCKDFIRNLFVCARKNDNIRIVVCLRVHIEEFLEYLSGPYFKHPGDIQDWQNIKVKPFDGSQAKQLLNFLPENAKKVALEKFNIIEAFSANRPRKLQCLCDKLFVTANETTDESKLIDIINNQNSYL